MKNVEFMYEYRDGSNCKRVGSGVFTNRIALDIGYYEQRLAANCDDGQFFIAHQVNIPELFHWKTEPHFDANEEDHCWHAFVALRETDADPTDQRDLSEFLLAFERIRPEGWEDFSVMAMVRNDAPAGAPTADYYHRSNERPE